MSVDWLRNKPVFFFSFFRTLLFWTWFQRNPIIWMQLFRSLELYLMGNNSSVENYYSSLERSGSLALRYLVSLLFFFFLFLFLPFFNVLHNHFVQKMGHCLDLTVSLPGF